MKIQINKRSGEQGTALLVALFLTTILAVTIAGYMKHAQQQNQLSARSQVWNTAIAVSEAGIEDALQHLTKNTNNLAKDGWAGSGSTYTVTRDLSDTARYKVKISLASSSKPEIVCQAYVLTPEYASAASSVTDWMFAQIAGGNVSTSPNQITTEKAHVEISRAVRVRLSKKGMFQGAMVAKHKIDMNGNNVMTDSFNSSSTTFSTGGMYDPSKARDNGDVASNDTVANTVAVGNANIYGRVRVGPGGTVDVGSNGGVGTRLWQSWNNGIQPGYFSDDMNFTFPSITLPYTTGLTPSSGTVSTTNYTLGTGTTTSSTFPSPVPSGGVVTNLSYTTVSSLPSPIPFGTVTNFTTTRVLESAFPAAGTYIGTVEVVGKRYRFDKITGRTFTYPRYTYTYSYVTTNQVVTTKSYDYIIDGGLASMAPVKYYLSSLGGSVLVRGNAQLVVGGDVVLKGTETFEIASNGKLEMWANGTEVKLAGNGVINNNGYAQNFILWCTDKVTSMTLNGNGEFTGVLVAPNAAVQMNGGGNADEDFIGALIVKSVTMNGHFKFHYDEALESLRDNGRFTMEQWDEIPVTQTGF